MTVKEILSPPLSKRQKLIAKLDPLQFPELVNGISTVSKFNPESIFIDKSKITFSTSYEKIIAQIDCRALTPDPLSMQFFNDKEKITALKSITGKEDVSLIHDRAKGAYIFSNGHLNVTLTEDTRRYNPLFIPEISNDDQEITVQVPAPKQLQRMTRKNQYVHLLMYGKHLGKVWISDDQIYSFTPKANGEFITPSLSLRSHFFLKIAGLEVSMKVVMLNNVYWSVTNTTLGKGIPVVIYEYLTIIK